MNILNDTCIILQGYSKDANQLLELVKYYNNLGIKNIIVSTYSLFITPELKNICKIIVNDIDNSKEHQNVHMMPIKHLKKNVNVVFDDKIYYPTGNSNFDILSKVVNCQLLTTNRGLNMANDTYPNAKYYLKCRADMKIENLNKLINIWKEKIKFENGTALENKLLTNKINIKNIPFYNTDYFTFGLKNDIKKYYNIPYITTTKEETFYKYLVKNKIFNVETYLAGCYFSLYFKSNKIKYDDIKKYFICDNNIKLFWYKIKNYL